MPQNDSPEDTKEAADVPAKNDPVVPYDDPPKDLPGTAGGVKAEVEGNATHVSYGGVHEARSQYQSVADIGRINAANRIKNQGVRAALPPWTIPGVEFRILHFGTGTIRAIQAREVEAVRRTMSWPKSEPLPKWGEMEVFARTAIKSIVGCTKGDAVDLDGAVRASHLRNEGIVYAHPSRLLPGLRIRYRHLGHPWLAILRADVEAELKTKLGVSRREDLPEEATAEADRIMMLASIVECVEGKVSMDGASVNLAEMGTFELRDWFERNLLPPADLRGKVPAKREDQEAYYAAMFANHNPDVVNEMATAHGVIRRVRNEELLARGKDFVAGADWEYKPGTAKYKPRGALVDLTQLPLGELRDLLRESFFPRVDLKAAVPQDRQSREEHFVKVFGPFSNAFLDEFMTLETEIREADPEVVLDRGKDFVAGLGDDTDSSD